MSPEFCLDKTFWRAFTHTHWNRRPTVIRAPFPTPIVTPAEVFRAVVAARRRLSEPTDDLELLIGGRRIVMDRDRWFPRAQDVSMERYQARLKRAGIAGQLAINVTDFQDELGWTFYNRLRQFLGGLYEIAGVPPRAEVDLFLGDYRSTPMGVHRDEADVFCLVVQGKKRFRLWPAEAIRSSSPRYGPAPYTNHVKRSLCLEGGPGDIFYWPSSYWHVGESDGQAGSSLSVGLYYGYSLTRAMTENLGEWSRETWGDGRDPVASLPFSKLQVPAELASIAQRAEGRPGRLTKRLMRFWMGRITGYGFGRIPRARGRAALQMGRRVCANPISPFLYWKINGDLVISANGRSIVVSYDREIVRMLGRVSRGSVCEVAGLLKTTGRTSQRMSRKPAHKTLQFLLDERALEYA
ncbi:MAG TPA: cupin domain-containing protein [Candidatus Acidoferrales bacterium]|nr:cupin domain-containing protein [Candidatus Acidoferrales bacterium]